MTDLPTPADGNAVRPAPFLTLLAVIAMPLLGFGSEPFWIWRVAQEIRSNPGNYAPDPAQSASFTILSGVVMTTAVGAILGLVAAWLAGRRNERWRGLRISAWIINGLGAVLGAIFLIGLLV